MIDFNNDRRFRHVVFRRGVELPRWALLQIIQALPEDAILFHCDFDLVHHQCFLAFWSSEFEHVPCGRAIPSVTGWIDTARCKAGLGEALP